MNNEEDELRQYFYCNKCCGLFVSRDEAQSHTRSCTGSPQESTASLFTCSKQNYLKVTQPPPQAKAEHVTYKKTKTGRVSIIRKPRVKKSVEEVQPEPDDDIDDDDDPPGDEVGEESEKEVSSGEQVRQSRRLRHKDVTGKNERYKVIMAGLVGGETAAGLVDGEAAVEKEEDGDVAKDRRVTVKVEGVSLLLSEEETPVKRKRGRPRKVFVESGEELNKDGNLTQTVVISTVKTTENCEDGSEENRKKDSGDVEEDEAEEGNVRLPPRQSVYKTRNGRKRVANFSDGYVSQKKKRDAMLEELTKKHAEYDQSGDSSTASKYVCHFPDCSFTTGHVGHFDRHLKSCHEADGFKCRQCEFRTDRKIYYQRHMLSHTKPYKCDECEARFSRKKHVELHQLKHKGGDYPYQCDQCPYQTRFQTSFKEHKYKHTGEGYKCDLCSFHTPYRTSLKNHIAARHTQSVTYSCEHCSYVTHAKGNLIAHSLKHSGPPSYHCPYCAYRGYRKAEVIKHLRSHSKEQLYYCDRCSFSSSYSYNFRVHMLTHLNLMPYQCSVCGFNSVTKQRVQRHVKAKHPSVSQASVISLGLKLDLKLSDYRRQSSVQYVFSVQEEGGEGQPQKAEDMQLQKTSTAVSGPVIHFYALEEGGEGQPQKAKDMQLQKTSTADEDTIIPVQTETHQKTEDVTIVAGGSHSYPSVISLQDQYQGNPQSGVTIVTEDEGEGGGVVMREEVVGGDTEAGDVQLTNVVVQSAGGKQVVLQMDQQALESFTQGASIILQTEESGETVVINQDMCTDVS